MLVYNNKERDPRCMNFYIWEDGKIKDISIPIIKDFQRHVDRLGYTNKVFLDSDMNMCFCPTEHQRLLLERISVAINIIFYLCKTMGFSFSQFMGKVEETKLYDKDKGLVYFLLMLDELDYNTTAEEFLKELPKGGSQNE